MKIILRKDVDNLGERGDVVNVAPGFARNYLLPKGMAMRATPGNMRSVELEKKIWSVREMHEAKAAQVVADRIAALKLEVTRKAGESETLYGSVTNADVAELLAAHGIEIDRRKILLSEPIKSLGQHDVSVKLHKQVTAQVQVTVLPEAGEEPAGTKAETEAEAETGAESDDTEDGA